MASDTLNHRSSREKPLHIRVGTNIQRVSNQKLGAMELAPYCRAARIRASTIARVATNLLFFA
jgi:hypothetical protein